MGILTYALIVKRQLLKCVEKNGCKHGNTLQSTRIKRRIWTWEG